MKKPYWERGFPLSHENIAVLAGMQARLAADKDKGSPQGQPRRKNATSAAQTGATGATERGANVQNK